MWKQCQGLGLKKQRTTARQTTSVTGYRPVGSALKNTCKRKPHFGPRGFASLSSHEEVSVDDFTVDLFSDVIEDHPRFPDTTGLGAILEDTKKCPTHIVITHGLFGQSSNWRGIAKALSERIGTKTHLLDMRNHGGSPGTPHMSYDIMVADIRRYMEKHSMEKVIFLGHSMGGRVGMQLALEYPDLIDKLIVVDVAPVSYLPIEEFSTYISYMKSVDLGVVKCRKEVDDFLRGYIPNFALRKFLLTNLITDKSGNHPFKWKLNFAGIEKSLPDLRSFPIKRPDAKYPSQCLFIGGGQSDYIKREHIPSIQAYFPQYQLEWIDGAGHWVHADKPLQFLDIVTQFLMKPNQNASTASSTSASSFLEGTMEAKV